MTNRKGGVSRFVMLPDHLEYSEKDDKFRLLGSGNRSGRTVNVGRITKCEAYPGKLSFSTPAPQDEKETIEFILTDKRNALERALLHFAHFEKQAKRIDETHYSVGLTYDKPDETELVIRVLSFGPMIKVTSPESFVGLIKERLEKQKSCGL